MSFASAQGLHDANRRVTAKRHPAPTQDGKDWLCFFRTRQRSSTAPAGPSAGPFRTFARDSDNLATGWAAIERARLEPGESVAVIGGGTVGQLASLAAPAAGASAVVVVEPSEACRTFARANGALPADPREARDLIERMTERDGVDVVIEAVGSAATLTNALEVVRKRGRVVSVGAHTSKEWPLPLARCFADEITLSFAIGDAIRLRPRLFGLIRSGVLDPTVVIEERLVLDQVAEGYRRLREQQILKAVIDPRR